jgi:hypothetical protein
MALSQGQYFEQYWPSSEYYQQLQGYANAKIRDGNTVRNPTGGEMARMESQLRSAAMGSPQFQQSWGIYESQQQAASAAAALAAQQAEQAKVLGEAQKQVEAAQQQAAIAGKRSAATSAQIRSQAQLEQAQVQAAQQQTFQQAQRRKSAGATVGQPGRTTTRVSSGLGIGGYGGTAAGRITPTGLNI